MEEVWHHNKISMHRKLVSDELGIYEPVTNDVSESINQLVSTRVIDMRPKSRSTSTYIKTPYSVDMLGG